MMLACLLFAPYRTLCDVVHNHDGTVDEAQTFTPPMIATLQRILNQSQREFLDSPVRSQRPFVQRWHGKSTSYAAERAIREALR